jgi:hypothetical protein
MVGSGSWRVKFVPVILPFPAQMLAGETESGPHRFQQLRGFSGLSLISGLQHALDDRLLAGDSFLSFHDVTRGHGQRGFVAVFHGVTCPAGG